MIDELLAFACMFDWITPAAALIEGLWRGPYAVVSVPTSTGVSRGEIRKALEHYGIRAWGLTYSGSNIYTYVPKPQARYAQYLVDRLFLGDATLPHQPAPRTDDQSQSHQSEERRDALDRLFEALDSIGGSLVHK
jgi:hypothetical protein